MKDLEITANINKSFLCSHVAFVGLGSNVPEKYAVLDNALQHLVKFDGVYLLDVSTVYETEPQDYLYQPWFANQVLKLALSKIWDAEKLLNAMLELETKLGRKRDPSLRFGPREIDIDLLLFDNLKIRSSNCVLPHPRMCQRAFVLLPLYEIAPDIEINGQPINYWLNKLDWRKEDKRIFQALHE